MTNLHPDLDPDDFIKRNDLPDLADQLFDNYYEGINNNYQSSKNSSGCGCFMWFVFVLVVAVITIYSKQ